MEIIKEIKIKELRSFIDSQEYKELENIPISYHRAVSYINNPRATKEDLAVVCLYKDNLLIAYRCLFSDFLISNKEKHKFSWISGSWVHPNYRRQGYSMKLLKHCFLAQKGQLMFSNFAPESKSLYDKSGFFKEIANLDGGRFYFRFSLSELLPAKHPFFKKIKPFLSISDYILNFYFDIRFFLKNTKTNRLCFHETENVDIETQDFIKEFQKQNPFKRGKKEINHAKRFPWIIQTAHPNKRKDRYYFSSSSKVFKNIMLKLYNEDMKISAFLYLTIRDHSLTIPYTFFEEIELTKLVKIVMFYVKKYKISYFTSFNTRINKEMLKQRTFILFSKKRSHLVYAGKKIAPFISDSNHFFAGDGDSLYT